MSDIMDQRNQHLLLPGWLAASHFCIVVLLKTPWVIPLIPHATLQFYMRTSLYNEIFRIIISAGPCHVRVRLSSMLEIAGKVAHYTHKYYPFVKKPKYWLALFHQNSHTELLVYVSDPLYAYKTYINNACFLQQLVVNY